MTDRSKEEKAEENWQIRETLRYSGDKLREPHNNKPLTTVYHKILKVIKYFIAVLMAEKGDKTTKEVKIKKFT